MRYISLLIIVLLMSCTPNGSTATPILLLGETDMPAFHYLALGDSYTIGEKVSAKDRWPNQLAKLLEVEGIQTEVTIIARTGWTVEELWQGIQANPPQGQYDLVTLLIGVNDQYRGYSIDGYREDFRFMLGKAIEYAGGDPEKVVVLSIPDWGFTPFAANRDTEPISQQIDEFNAVNLEETKSASAHYVDVTIISRMAMDDFELIAEDRLHPSGKMYAMWVEKTLPVVRDILMSSKKEKP
jgi:lysophospholipase L1-like esterase